MSEQSDEDAAAYYSKAMLLRPASPAKTSKTSASAKSWSSPQKSSRSTKPARF